MRNLEELKRDLKKYWLDNGKDFEKLRDKILDNPYYGGVYLGEYLLLKGKNAKKKAKKLVKEWELEDEIESTLDLIDGFRIEWSENKSEEKPLPRIVMVRDDDNEKWVERELLCIIPGDMKYRYVCEFGKGYDYPTLWQQMKEIEEVPEYTIEDLTDKLGHKFKIKKGC